MIREAEALAAERASEPYRIRYENTVLEEAPVLCDLSGLSFNDATVGGCWVGKNLTGSTFLRAKTAGARFIQCEGLDNTGMDCRGAFFDYYTATHCKRLLDVCCLRNKSEVRACKSNVAVINLAGKPDEWTVSMNGYMEKADTLRKLDSCPSHVPVGTWYAMKECLKSYDDFAAERDALFSGDAP